jgi:hypothetical protein
MSTIKHSKYKNSGILFELLVRQITSDILEGKDSKATGILKKYFHKTELGKEHKLYESLLKNISLNEMKANVVLDTLLNASKNLNKSLIKRQKYNLINEIKKYYDLNKFFNNKLPQYKIQAAFYTLLEAQSPEKQVKTEQLINNKVTILEYLTSSKISTSQKQSSLISEFNELDKDTKLLTYRILLNKFNTKYSVLETKQKLILKELINSMDNQPKLKEYYSQQIDEVKNELKKINKSTKDKIVHIKINEIISNIKPLSKTQTIKDKDLVDLLQYYDLINELNLANGKS